MATAKQHYLIKDSRGEPAVIQDPINGFELSWNPDDARFYVEKAGETKATFNAWRNAVYFAKTH